METNTTKSKAEKILDKHLKCDTYPVWRNGKVVNYIHENNCVKCSIECKVLQAMEEFASTEQKSNTKLIAAAPEMLEVLQLITNTITTLAAKDDNINKGFEGLIKLSNQVIKKATE